MRRYKTPEQLKAWRGCRWYGLTPETQKAIGWNIRTGERIVDIERWRELTALEMQGDVNVKLHHIDDN